MMKNISSAEGLSESEAQTRLNQYGYNELVVKQTNLFWGILKRFWGPIPWMLEGALLLELFLGKIVEPVIITGLLIFSAVVGGTQERRAQVALNLLRSCLQISSRVARDGNWKLIPARELVPGDKVHLRVGDLIPADCTIRNGTVEIDQSMLTGESASVPRTTNETVYSGSIVRRGDATGIVIATGSNSYFGRTAELVRTANPVGHLEKLLFTVVRYLVIIDSVLAVILVVVALV